MHPLLEKVDYLLRIWDFLNRPDTLLSYEERGWL